MRPLTIVRLGPTSFQNEALGLGTQLVKLVETIERIRPDLNWYAADVQATGHSPVPPREPQPTLVGDTAKFLGVAQRVEQFESAVFAGVPASVHNPSFRAGGLWTEDEEAADLGDAVVELRAFDTSCWYLATAEPDIASEILKKFPRSSTS